MEKCYKSDDVCDYVRALQSESGSGFEFGDDGIVPCTPTLQVPQRSDGFAEAVW